MTTAPAASPVPDWDWYPGHVPDNVVFGANCWLPSAYPFRRFRSTRATAMSVGDRTSFGVETVFDLGPDGELRVGATCNVVGATFATNGRIVLGDHVLVSIRVLFADHGTAVPPLPLPTDRYGELMAGRPETVVGDNVWIGVGAVVLGGVTIGEGAIVGAATVVDRDVPPYAVVAGNPSRLVGWARPGQRRSADAGVVE